MNQPFTIKDLANTFNEATAYQRNGQKDEARQKYEQILLHEKMFEKLAKGSGPENQAIVIKAIYSKTYNNLGIFLEEENLPGQALAKFRTALNFSQGNVEALTNMARVFAKRANFDQAYEAGKKALAIKPDYVPAVIQFCRVCYVFGRPVDGLKALEAVTDQLAKNARLNIEKGRLLEKAGQLNEARECLEAAVEVDPKNLYGHLNLANVNFQLGRFQAALENYQAILAIRPKHLLALTGLGFLLQTMGQFNEAMTCYQNALKENPGHDETLGFYASLLAVMDKPEEALEVSKKLLSLPKLSERAFITGSVAKAGSERKLGQLEDALETAGNFKAQAKSPAAKSQAHYELGFALDQMKKTGEAFQAFEAANTYFAEANKDLLARKDEYPALLKALLQSKFEKPKAPKKSGGSDVPVFVVGPLLGGSSAVGQLLALIPKMQVFEDSHAIQGIRRRLRDAEGGYPGCLTTLKEEEIEHLKALYGEIQEKSVFKGEKGQMIDVDGLHLPDLPLIKKVFPDAKIIFVGCDPRDAVLNAYIKDFQPSVTALNFTDLGEISSHYRATLDIWEKYQAEMGLDALEIRYEDFIKDPAKGVQKVLKFIGHKDTKEVKKVLAKDNFFTKATALVTQYPPNRWKGYQAHLEGILKDLDPYAKRLGYKA